MGFGGGGERLGGCGWGGRGGCMGFGRGMGCGCKWGVGCGPVWLRLWLRLWLAWLWLRFGGCVGCGGRWVVGCVPVWVWWLGLRLRVALCGGVLGWGVAVVLLGLLGVAGGRLGALLLWRLLLGGWGVGGGRCSGGRDEVGVRDGSGGGGVLGCGGLHPVRIWA